MFQFLKKVEKNRAEKQGKKKVSKGYMLEGKIILTLV